MGDPSLLHPKKSFSDKAEITIPYIIIIREFYVQSS